MHMQLQRSKASSSRSYSAGLRDMRRRRPVATSQRSQQPRPCELTDERSCRTEATKRGQRRCAHERPATRRRRQPLLPAPVACEQCEPASPASAAVQPSTAPPTSGEGGPQVALHLQPRAARAHRPPPPPPQHSWHTPQRTPPPRPHTHHSRAYPQHTPQGALTRIPPAHSPQSFCPAQLTSRRGRRRSRSPPPWAGRCTGARPASTRGTRRARARRSARTPSCPPCRQT